MKKRRNFFVLVISLKVIFAVCLAVIHFINRRIFAKCGNESSLNGLWKSGYGDITFLKKGSGKPILLVHGTGVGAGSSEWSKHVDALAKTRTVYALDLPGYGNSEKRPMTYNSYYYAKVINGFIKNVIGQKTDVAASGDSCGFVLAGAALAPSIYNTITAINPYEKGMGAEYNGNSFYKMILSVPIIGTFIYNCISSKNSIMCYFDKTSHSLDDCSKAMRTLETRYRNAHLFGANNKYSLICQISGYYETPVFKLMENCITPLNVVVSSNSPMPLLAEREGLTITEIKYDGDYTELFSGDTTRIWS